MTTTPVERELFRMHRYSDLRHAVDTIDSYRSPEPLVAVPTINLAMFGINGYPLDGSTGNRA